MPRGKELTEKQAEWLGHIKRSEMQGQSLAAYGQAHGIKVKQLYQWRWLLKKKGQLSLGKKAPDTQKWLPVITEPKMPNRCLMRLPNGIELEWDNGYSIETLLQVIAGVTQR